MWLYFQVLFIVLTILDAPNGLVIRRLFENNLAPFISLMFATIVVKLTAKLHLCSQTSFQSWLHQLKPAVSPCVSIFVAWRGILFSQKANSLGTWRTRAKQLNVKMFEYSWDSFMKAPVFRLSWLPCRMWTTRRDRKVAVDRLLDGWVIRNTWTSCRSCAVK